MAQFEADIKLDLLTGPAERQLRKIERNIDKIEDASRDILQVEKKIVDERRKLITLDMPSQPATSAKRSRDSKSKRLSIRSSAANSSKSTAWSVNASARNQTAAPATGIKW